MRRRRWAVIVYDVEGEELYTNLYWLKSTAEREARRLNAEGRAAVDRMRPALTEAPPYPSLYTAEVVRA